MEGRRGGEEDEVEEREGRRAGLQEADGWRLENDQVVVLVGGKEERRSNNEEEGARKRVETIVMEEQEMRNVQTVQKKLRPNNNCRQNSAETSEREKNRYRKKV